MKGPDATSVDSGEHEEWNVGKAGITGSKDEVREDKLTKCRLCGEMFNDPRMLPCLHTFCLQCLENVDLPLTSTSRSPGELTCPCCREEFPLPVGGLGRLPLNVFFARLAERRRTLSSVDNVDSSREVNYLLLLRRTVGHARFPSSRKHSIMQRTALQAFSIRQQEVKVIWQKAPHGGPIPRLGVTPGGRKLYTIEFVG